MTEPAVQRASREDQADSSAPTSSVRRRTGGRSARVRSAVLDAVIAILAESGLTEMTMAEVARRAGVHQSSIQRRWGNLDSLVLDTLLSYSEELIPVPDTGTLRGDLTELSVYLSDYLSTGQGAALTQVMATVEDDPDLARERAQFWRSRRHAVGVLFQRAVERGEASTGADADTALEMLVARIHFRCLLTREPVDTAFIERTIDFILLGVKS